MVFKYKKREGAAPACRRGGCRTLVVLMLLLSPGFISPDKTAASQQEAAGSFFGDPVSKGNYYFILRIVLSFNSPWGGIPGNRQQLEDRIWDELLLSYEAYRRQISVGKKELEVKIAETLKGNKVSFNRKEDSDAYAQWVRETLGESVEMFENQMRHLVQIKKLHTRILDSISTPVTEKEAFQEFLNERNSLSVELAEFDELEEAQKFYEKVSRNPAFWGQEAEKDKQRVREDRSFRHPGFVALEFLMDIWKFPKKAVYDMIEMEIDGVYPPAPIYEGYGVFKIRDIRRADESEFPQRRESYFSQLRMKKRYQGFKDWLENLRKDADTQVYIEPPPELFQ